MLLKLFNKLYLDTFKMMKIRYKKILDALFVCLGVSNPPNIY